MEKLTSRKFWLAVAAFLGSVAATIGGIVTDHEIVTVVGIICGTLSAAIYAAAEAYVDAASATTFDISVCTDNDEIIEKVILDIDDDEKIGGTD